MRDKVPIIKNRDRSDYQFDTHKWIDLAGADYLTDNDDFSVILFGPITSPKVSLYKQKTTYLLYLQKMVELICRCPSILMVDYW